MSSASMGWANSGTLQHARRLTETQGIRFVPGRPLRWGTEELVALLERVGATMHRRFSARLSVGDLSAQQGGPVCRHRSHQSGRDVDLGFFARHASPRGIGAPIDLNDYVAFDAAGRSLDGRYVFDTARNWAVIETFLSDRRVTVERVFIAASLRARLLAWARAHGADESLIDRAALTLYQPRGVSPHDNHMHVRIACPDNDAQCRQGVHRPRVLRRRIVRAAHNHATRHEHARRAPARTRR
jgi:penicillin-insensitive murein endopeptidase